MVSRRNVGQLAFVAAQIVVYGSFVLVVLEACHRINKLFWIVAFRLSGDVGMLGDFAYLVSAVGVVSFAVGAFWGLIPGLVLDAIDRRRVK